MSHPSPDSQYQTIDPARLDAVPITIKQVSISGNKTVDAQLIEQQLEELRHARNWGQIHQLSAQSLQQLKDLDLFTSCDIVVDKSSGSVSQGGINARATVKVEEKRPFSLRAEAEQAINSGEQSGRLIGMYRNLLGKGEIWNATVGYGTKFSQVVDVGVARPMRIADRRVVTSIRAFSDVDTRTQESSFISQRQGIDVALRTSDGVHAVAYTAAHRNTVPRSRAASQRQMDDGVYTGPSARILQHSFPSFKSAVRYQHTQQDLNHHLAPTSGSYQQTSIELAGLGGDVSHIRTEMDAKRYFPLSNDLVGSLSVHAGYMQPLATLPTVIRRKQGTASNNPLSRPQPLHRTHLVDRFTLGGPMGLRGFQPSGVGPKDGLDALGGDLFASASAAISTAIPAKWAEDWGVRGQAFINAGNLIQLPTITSKQSLSERLSSFVSGARLSVGVGLVAPSPIGRIEISLAKPLRSQPTDTPQTFAFGIGVKFL